MEFEVGELIDRNLLTLKSKNIDIYPLNGR